MGKKLTANRIVLILHSAVVVATAAVAFVLAAQGSLPHTWASALSFVGALLTAFVAGTSAVIKYLDGSQKTDARAEIKSTVPPVGQPEEPEEPEELPPVDDLDEDVDSEPTPEFGYVPSERLAGMAAKPDAPSSTLWRPVPPVEADEEVDHFASVERMHISERGLALIESFEGYSFHAYWDPFGHVWTVGYGETEGVGPASTMTREQAEEDLRRRITDEYAPAILALHVPLNQNQFDALCSFVWNVGPGSMEWDVGRYLRERNYAAAANALLEYTRAGGVVLAGLVRRREEERALFLTPVAAPKPPDPYAIFPENVHDASLANRGNERLTVQQADGALKHPTIYHAYLKDKMYWKLKAYRDRAKKVAMYEPPDFTKLRPHAAWGEDHLGARWQELQSRMERIEKL